MFPLLLAGTLATGGVALAQPTPGGVAGNQFSTAKAGIEAPESLRLRAAAFAKRGQVGEALVLQRRLLRLEPGNAQHRLIEAQYLAWYSRTASSGEGYRRLMLENPANAEAAEGYGNTQYWRSNWREAQTAYASAINASSTDNLGAQVGFQRALVAAGHATPAYRQAVELDQRTGHQDAELGLFLATIHAGVDHDEAALPLAGRRTTDLDVQVRQTTFVAERLVVRGRKDEGLKLIAEFAERHAQYYNALIAAGEVYTVAHEGKGAREYLDRAAQLVPDRDEAPLALARLARQQGKTRDSLALYEDVVARNLESLPGWLGVADLAQMRGDLNRAWQALDSAQRVAPGSALIYRERLKICFRENDAETFGAVLRDYRRTQPADVWAELWAQKWADTHGGEVNVAALEAILDPLDPESTSEALRLIRRHTGMTMPQAAARVPAAPGPELQDAAQAKLGKQVRASDPSIIGVSTGYEFAALHDTSGAGAHLQAWHEGYVAAYWRRKLGMSVSGEYRTFSRFGQSANQLLAGWDTHLTPSWVAGLEAGGALNGGFIPRWRVGARTEYHFNERISADLSVSHLRFADEPVLQVVPGIRWQWHPQWSSYARMYVTHDSPKGASANTG
ncbi:MAG: YaiO family outer membrane beta-barrel protein, partial [Mycobacteriaceae bacterium]|nr:YaiO family outer membrane beta-barrel protein [Mycobacteriaceae bacterium]